jgi:23S rRNA (uridine2552-2'-O)-methyltransferase
LARADYKRPDFYARQAREKGFAARSVFKLAELDQKEKLLRPGDRVLDLGAAPGSWMQYTAGRVGARGLVVGVDLQELFRPLQPNERFVQADVFERPAEDLLARFGIFQVVLSDLAPSTMGDKATDHFRSIALAERALALGGRVLRPGGHFLVKVFMGADFEAFVGGVRRQFGAVKLKKPKSSRATSPEMYILGREFIRPSAGEVTRAPKE